MRCSNTKKLPLAILESNYFSSSYIHFEPLLNSELNSFQAIFFYIYCISFFFRSILNYGAFLQKLSNNIFFKIWIKRKTFSNIFNFLNMQYYLTSSRLILFRHYITRWNFKYFVGLFVTCNLVEYHHSLVAFEPQITGSNRPWAFVHIYLIKLFYPKLEINTHFYLHTSYALCYLS